MHLFFNNAKNAALCIIAVAVAWVLFFKLNFLIFSYFAKNQFVSLVFVPAGIRLVSVLLLEEYAVAGLFIGALITSPVASNITESLVISLISAINPYIAVHMTKRLLNIDNLLNNLHAKELILMGLFSSLLNCVSHHLYFSFEGLAATWDTFLNMIVGDLLGIAIILFLFSMSLKIIRKSTLTSATQ